MKWVYRSLMAIGAIGASLVTAGILPVAFTGVAVAVTGAAALFHDSPLMTTTPPKS